MPRSIHNKYLDMTKFKYTLFVTLMLFASFLGFSQTTRTESTKSENKIHRADREEEPRTDGLKKISTTSAIEDDFDIDFDEEAFEANIERAVEKAMSSLEVAMDRLETNMESLEMTLEDLDPIEIPELNLEPFEVDLGDLDIDIDIDENKFKWNDSEELDFEENDEFLRDKDKVKSKSDNEKSKGLKKIN
jgi:hypothetical protein